MTAVVVAAGPNPKIDADLAELFGVRYVAPGASEILDARPTNLYFHRTYVGVHAIALEHGDCCYWIGDDARSACLRRGPAMIHSRHMATVIRGYMPEDKTTTIHQGTTLPYVNGCSTKQLFSAERPGDPTLQLLYMPPHTTEQAHHIHSTARVVYVLSGRGTSVVGIDNKIIRHPLVPGTVCVLEPMCPHHFETKDEALMCIPLHIFSSVGRQEWNHPMFHGTHLIDR
jgi:hypothetical protein